MQHRGGCTYGKEGGGDTKTSAMALCQTECLLPRPVQLLLPALDLTRHIPELAGEVVGGVPPAVAREDEADVSRGRVVRPPPERLGLNLGRLEVDELEGAEAPERWDKRQVVAREGHRRSVDLGLEVHHHAARRVARLPQQLGPRAEGTLKGVPRALALQLDLALVEAQARLLGHCQAGVGLALVNHALGSQLLRPLVVVGNIVAVREEYVLHLANTVQNCPFQLRRISRRVHHNGQASLGISNQPRRGSEAVTAVVAKMINFQSKLTRFRKKIRERHSAFPNFSRGLHSGHLFIAEVNRARGTSSHCSECCGFFL
mmetsp:Transcript_14029/g.33135  ORF Transcript_14029/g.33135 Transcript_14029/m.33135 type:complete len:316 (-) Transcript_14029:391-1338(-)